MLRTTVEQLEEEERNDRLPDWDDEGNVRPPPIEARADNERTRDMNETKEVVKAEGWEEVGKSVTTGGRFLKLTDGQAIDVNICGVPKHIEKDWGDGKGPQTRVQIEVFVPGGGKKIWDQAPATWSDLKDEKAFCKHPFADAVFNIKRAGSGSDTRYKMRYQRQLTAAEVNERSTVANASLVGGDDIPF